MLAGAPDREYCGFPIRRTRFAAASVCALWTGDLGIRQRETVGLVGEIRLGQANARPAPLLLPRFERTSGANPGLSLNDRARPRRVNMIGGNEPFEAVLFSGPRAMTRQCYISVMPRPGIRWKLTLRSKLGIAALPSGPPAERSPRRPRAVISIARVPSRNRRPQGLLHDAPVEL
jgi:hypothetical protein